MLASASPFITDILFPVTLSIYLVSASGLFISSSDANTACISRSCDGLAIAIVRPWLIAIAIKLLLTNILSGRPNDILESPQAVATSSSFLQ